MDRQEYIDNMLTTDEMISLLNKVGKITRGNCRVVATHDIHNTYFETHNIKERDMYFIESTLSHLPYAHIESKVKGKIDFNSPKTLMNSVRGNINDIEYYHTIRFRVNNKEYKQYYNNKKKDNKEIIR